MEEAKERPEIAVAAAIDKMPSSPERLAEKEARRKERRDKEKADAEREKRKEAKRKEREKRESRGESRGESRSDDKDKERRRREKEKERNDKEKLEKEKTDKDKTSSPERSPERRSRKVAFDKDHSGSSGASAAASLFSDLPVHIQEVPPYVGSEKDLSVPEFSDKVDMAQIKEKLIDTVVPHAQFQDLARIERYNNISFDDWQTEGSRLCEVAASLVSRLVELRKARIGGYREIQETIDRHAAKLESHGQETDTQMSGFQAKASEILKIIDMSL